MKLGDLTPFTANFTNTFKLDYFHSIYKTMWMKQIRIPSHFSDEQV